MKVSEVAGHFGSKRALAKQLGISEAAVSYWGEVIPLSRQYQIEVITKGKFKAVSSCLADSKDKATASQN